MTKSDPLLVPFLLFQLQLFASPWAVAASEWTIDPKSTIEFTTMTGTHLRAKGTFSNLSGKLIYDEKRLANANVVAFIPLHTLSTGIAVRDEDLMGPKYFQISKFPQAKFTSTKLIKQQNGDFQLQGQLSLHGMSRSVCVSVERGPQVNGNILSATGKSVIDHKDFGLNLVQLHPDGKVWINKDIVIKINLIARKSDARKSPASKKHSG